MIDQRVSEMRKVRLSPAQRDALWLLSEAGTENLPCIRATLSYSSVDLEDALTGLKRLGFVIDDVEGSLPALTLTDAGRSAIST